MTKKMISWLAFMAVFLLFLHSCVHDEIYAVADPDSKEYHSKSLWKEDEKYIKNVKTVFENYADKNYFTHKAGEIYWDYSLTMGTSETFLEVPVVKNKKVSFILLVYREGERIFFKRKDDDNSKNFFNALLFNDRKFLTGTKLNNSLGNQAKGGCVSVDMTWTWTNESTGEVEMETTQTDIYCLPSGPSLPCEALDTVNNCGGGSGSSGGGGSGGGSPAGYPYPQQNQTPCTKIKSIVNNAQLKPKIDELKNFSLTAERDEKGYQQDKSGNVTPAPLNGVHHVDFIIDQNSQGGIHSHTLNGGHMFSPKDILTFLNFAGVQNQTLPVGSTADNTGNAFLGMISQSGSYFITFNGGSADLPPPMTQAEEDALEIKMNKEYKDIKENLLTGELKSPWDTLSEKGLQKLFFDIIKKMGLEGKINLIKQEGSNTSTIEQNSDGTIKQPIPC